MRSKYRCLKYRRAVQLRTTALSVHKTAALFKSSYNTLIDIRTMTEFFDLNRDKQADEYYLLKSLFFLSFYYFSTLNL